MYPSFSHAIVMDNGNLCEMGHGPCVFHLNYFRKNQEKSIEESQLVFNTVKASFILPARDFNENMYIKLIILCNH